MNDTSFWSQGWWQSVGVIASVVLGVIAIIVTIRQNKRKKLSYKILYSEPLFNVNNHVKKNLKITFKGYEVEQIHILQIQIINNGDIPIKESDFSKPIVLKLQESNNIVDFEITTCKPQDLNISYIIEDKKVIFGKSLMNPNDFFICRLTFDSVNRNFSLSARIEGIDRILMIDNKEILKEKLFKRYFIVLSIFGLVSISSLLVIKGNSIYYYIIVFGGLLLILFTAIYYGIKIEKEKY